MLAKPAEGIRFHRTILEEFYRVAFRKKLYSNVEQLQQDGDVGLRPAVGGWIDSYNCTRPYSGRYCYGKTPMQTFLDSKAIVQQKMLEWQPEDTIKGEQNNGKQHVEESKTSNTPPLP